MGRRLIRAAALVLLAIFYMQPAYLQWVEPVLLPEPPREQVVRKGTSHPL